MANITPSIDYAWGQLVRAQQRGNAAAVAQWEAVIEGMRAGTIQVGSRTPTAAPAWVTLGVATGGFATGMYAARGGEDCLAKNLQLATSHELDARLDDGAYRIDVPEEGALLVVAWLRRHGHVEVAEKLLAELAPWFGTLRFYPADGQTPEPSDTATLQPMEKTIAQLDTGRRQPRFDTMRDAIHTWRPLRDRAYALLADETRDAAWTARRAALEADLARAGTPTTRRGKQAVELVAALDDDVKRRRLLRHVPRERDDAKSVAGPVHADLRRDAIERLCRGESVDDLALPPYFAAKASRSRPATLDELVDRDVIRSSEVLARVLPQITGYTRAQTLDDPAARRLYVALYTAFRRRRGLLLLNYAHQVRIHELPWVAALESTRAASSEATAGARSVVASASATAMRAFPATITPNKLVSELAALAQAAELELPLVEELAADIFMGGFSMKFAKAARTAARVVAGTLYATYYSIDTDALAHLPLSTDPKLQTSRELAALCYGRAGEPGTARQRVAYTGKVIEQAQILTTHNLAVLFDALALREVLDLPAVVDACFASVIADLRLPFTSYHRLLLAVKDAAYAWRQLVFFASFADVPVVLAQMRTRLARVRDASFRARFEPAMAGLEAAAAGKTPERVFTGWTLERHWIMPPAPPPARP